MSCLECIDAAHDDTCGARVQFLPECSIECIEIICLQGLNLWLSWQPLMVVMIAIVWLSCTYVNRGGSRRPAVGWEKRFVSGRCSRSWGSGVIARACWRYATPCLLRLRIIVLVFHCCIYVWFFCLRQSLQDLEPDFLDPDNLKDCRFYVHTNIIQSKPHMNGHSNVHARSTLEYCETPGCARLLCWHSLAHLQQFNSKVDRIWMGARWTGKENMRKLRFYGWNMDVWISVLCTFIFVSKFPLFLCPGEHWKYGCSRSHGWESQWIVRVC